jgi:DNA-binding NarL/FixJ family response regulator
VVVSSLSIDELVEALDAVARGGSTLSELERRVLIRQWREVRESPEHLLRQLHSVDEQDREILVMLYEGTTIRAVADRFGLSEAAVRAQVKAMLRRLSASSRVGGTDAGGEPGGLETRPNRS